ncbi:energy transducer TonB [Floridanema evergladense]|uniref:Energy transducer TonB n=1 Tax=Floridaenema evergladense BLCC-F167 TaxID=3153639 RepID=A0ABV4WN27_9CYAN
MSHLSPINTITGTLNLPLVVAALTSVGLHSLFWFYQPVVPMADKPTAVASDRRSVRVVQLTPEEILRLPEYAQQRTQPTLPLPQEQTPVNLLPSLPQAKSEVTLPAPPSFPIYNPNPSPPLPTPEVKTPEVKTPTSRRRDRTTVPKSPQETVKNNRRNNQSSRIKQPQIDEKITSRQSNLDSPSPTQKRAEIQLQQRNQSQPDRGMSVSQFEDSYNSYKRYLAQQQQNLNTTQSAQSAQSTQTTQSSQRRTQVRGNQNRNRNNETTGELLDRNPLQPNLVGGETSTQSQSQNRDDISLADLQSRNNLRNDINQEDVEARIKVSYGYDATNTRELDANATFNDWWKDKVRQYSNRLNAPKKPFDDTVRSSFKIKLPSVSQAGIAVLVDPEGKILETKLIQSTGYNQLNDLAIDQVKKRDFPASGKYEIYQYRFAIDQKDLPTASEAANR